MAHVAGFFHVCHTHTLSCAADQRTEVVEYELSALHCCRVVRDEILVLGEARNNNFSVSPSWKGLCMFGWEGWPGRLQPGACTTQASAAQCLLGLSMYPDMPCIV